ncbi:MAG TPA: hypothetical protein VFJ74_05550 [Gemmatimonadaceae bacterium]|nr:hypothetical protein [Gemmatimonadaceae bacterium]
MGAALSWLAVRGKAAAEVLDELHLRPTGVKGLEGESAYVGAASDDGWYLIVAGSAEDRLVGAAVVERLSAGCDVLTCTVEEHVMFSQATGWRDGRRLWIVTHRGEDGPAGIEEEGTLPPEYPAIRDRLVAQQHADGGSEADVDHLFDIPVALVQTFVGYKHDEVSPAFESRGFEVLESAHPEPAKRSWLGRLMSRVR